MGSAALNPLWRMRPAQLVMVAMVAMTVATSPPILGAFAEDASPAAWVAMLLITGGLAALLGWWTIRARETAGALTRILIGGGLAGWLNSVLCFVAWVSLAPPVGQQLFAAISAAPIVAVVGIAIGGPIGFGYGFGLLVPALLANRFGERLGPEVADRRMAGVGFWAAVVTLGLATFVLVAPSFAPSATARVLTLLFCSVTGALALVLTIAAVGRLWRRRAWLSRVRAGLVTDWVVIPWDTWRGRELDGVEPLLATPFPDAVLASATGEMGYREARRLCPRALVTWD